MFVGLGEVVNVFLLKVPLTVRTRRGIIPVGCNSVSR